MCSYNKEFMFESLNMENFNIHDNKDNIQTSLLISQFYQAIDDQDFETAISIYSKAEATSHKKIWRAQEMALNKLVKTTPKKRHGVFQI